MYTERIQVTLRPGSLARMAAVLNNDEDRLDLIREAIEKEILLRDIERGTATIEDAPGDVDRLRTALILIENEIALRDASKG